MINIFRKIRKSLLFSNKTSRYVIYAIGEVALVMIGILLALFVNNWNEERKQNRQLTNILKTVRTDLVSDTLTATQIVKFYDSINKYSEEVISYKYDSNTIEECTWCSSLTTLYQPYTIQDKGYLMLKNFDDFNFEKGDSLQTNILQFYKATTTIIDQSNDFIKAETLKNLDYYKHQVWFIDWMKGRSTDKIKAYFGDSIDYKNRVGSNLILASKNHGSFVKAHKNGAVELIESIDKILLEN